MGSYRSPSLVPVEARDDFRNFLYLVWKHLNLPDPTPAQYEAAYFLQYGLGGYDTINGKLVRVYDDPVKAEEWQRLWEEGGLEGRSDILEGYRGIGKSYISAAFTDWRLDRDPVDEKILVVSASSIKSREFVTQAKGLILTMPILAHLKPQEGQRDQADRFDVYGASLSQSPSLKAAGITGQITGSRATLIVADDIEIEANSNTEDARMRLMRAVSEFEAIKVPGADVCFLGTPQTEESIYNKLIKERSYRCFAWPARYPKSTEKRKSYILERDGGVQVDILAPPIAHAYDTDPSVAYQPTDPERFDDEELAGREGKGRSFFALQYQLDTSLSDAERYPLKQFDLIVMATNPHKAPMNVQWGRDSDGKNIRKEIHNYGFSGDYFLGPLFVDSEWRPYDGSVMFVDPSGRGKDECAWAILKVLNGTMFVCKVGGMVAPVDECMTAIALDAKTHNVNLVQVEPNYGGVMWISAFNPILAKIWPGGCRVEEAEWASGMKEARIIDTLEPVMNTHRLVVDESVARDEILMYQLTHIAKERNCLRHDDRIDALAGAVAYFVKAMMMDVNAASAAKLQQEFDEMLEDFMDTVQNGHSRVYQRSRRNKDAEVYRI